MEELKKLLPRFNGKKVLVFGDLMLDEHIWAKVNRISPEAPVPIADVTKITHVPGGSGNVAANIAALGGLPLLVGIIGRDSSGDKLRKVLLQNKVPTYDLIYEADRPTILKSRIIAASQQLVRVDREDRTDLSAGLRTRIIKKLKQLIPEVSAVIISDYGKGLVTKETSQFVISLCRKLGKPVTVDPKGKDYSKYRRATVVTPNQKEASIAAGLEINDENSLIKSGQALLSSVKAANILITRGRDGMSLFNKKEIVHIPVVSREVFDITGAGDTAIATLTLALTAGATVKSAADLANHAASLVVAKIGTAPCRLEELEADLEGREPMAHKIKTRQQIGPIIKNLKNEGAKVVFTNGCFDILHLGHARYLREAKKLGDILIVGLNTDASVRALKGYPRPYVPELERAEILASLECVDYVVLFSELRPDNLIKIIKPDVHVKGGDYDLKKLPERKLVESLGGKVVVIPPIKGRSTTNLVDKILGKK